MILEASSLRLEAGGRILVRDLSFSFGKGLVLVEGPPDRGSPSSSMSSWESASRKEARQGVASLPFPTWASAGPRFLTLP